MRARLMKAGGLAVLAAAGVLAWGGSKAQADGRCDLNNVIGYQVLFGKPIDSYVQNGVRKKGYEGCEPDRVLVFTDNTGVRCRGVALQRLGPLPTAYLFANNRGEMKLCVEGELFEVMTTNRWQYVQGMTRGGFPSPVVPLPRLDWGIDRGTCLGTMLREIPRSSRGRRMTGKGRQPCRG